MSSGENKGLRVAVVGSTGAVGKELLSILASREFPVSDLVLFASARSEGKSTPFGGRSFPVQVLKKGCFEGVISHSSMLPMRSPKSGFLKPPNPALGLSITPRRFAWKTTSLCSCPK